jgi:predicted  nucleic acid-binding Zn-ribbon protein
MKRIILLFITISIFVISCKDEKLDYINKVEPILNNLEQIGLEMDKTVEAVKSGGISILEFESRIKDIEKRLNTEKSNFNQHIAPMSMDTFHKNIVEAIAGEELAISSIKSYATRKNMLNLVEKQLNDLNKEEEDLSTKKDEKSRNRLSKISTEKANLKKQMDNLNSEMDAQMKFYSNSHEYFVKMVKAMKNALKGRSK